jgi:gliding motility-associated-like protein
MNALKIFQGSYQSYAKKFLLIMLVTFIGFNSYAQPINDDACAPITLTVSATCNYQTFTNAGATASPGVPVPGCSSYLGGDVWFQVVVPAGGALIFDTQIGVVLDAGMALYSGDCNNLVLIACDDDSSPNGAMPYLSRTGLIPGSTIWIRIWEYGNNNNGTFGICVTTPPPPPANDNCTGAIPLTVNPSFVCTASTLGTTVSATASTAPAPTCAATGVNDDVWFSFVATNTSHAISLTNVTGLTTNMAMSVYSGTCASLVHVQCSDPDNMTLIGLTAGQTYYVRVWTVVTTPGSFANFTICVGTPPPPPANDNCASAVGLTVNTNLACAITTTGTTASATPSVATAPTCGAGGVNDDVWYSFVATGNLHTITLTNVTGTATDMAMSVYSGACATLVHMQCSDPNTMTVNGLTAGQTYYVRVWTFTATIGSFGNFTICVGTPPPPPANDEPCNAITLNVAENGTCNFQQFTNLSATGTTSAPAPGCASYSGGDVWFKLTVPCTGSIILDSQTGGITDGGMAIYSGACTGLVLIECNDDGSSNGLMPRIARTGLVPGSTLFVRFWEYGNDNNGTFSICAQVPPPAPPAATCQTAQPFCTSTTPTTVPNITGQPSTAGGGIYGCLSSIPNPTYYYLQIQNSGNISVTISQTSTTANPLDVDFVVWGPFTSLNASCTGISAANIIDCSYSIAAVEVADIPNAVAGQFYLFLVTNYSDQAGTITYQQTGGTGSSNCSIVCTLNAGNNGPVCPGSPFNLSASVVANATYSWTGPNCFSSTLQNPTGVMAPLTPGQYVYTVTATGANGIACTDTTIVTVNPRPALGADSTIKICTGTTLNLTSLYTTTGLTTNWTLGGVAVNNPAAVSTAGIYRLIAANTFGCTDTAFVNLSVNVVDGTVASSNANCTTNGTITVTPTSGISPYQFAISTTPTVFQSSNVFSANNGSYVITIKDSFGCTITKPVTIALTNNLSVATRPDTTICTGGSVVLNTVSNATSFSWAPSGSLNNATIASPTAMPAAGNTRYVVTAVLGQCTAIDDVNITVEQAIQLNAGSDITLIIGDQAQFNATATGGNINSVLWTPPTGLTATNILQPLVKPTTTTLYTLSVTNDRGCRASDDILVTVIPYCIKVKNAFTPNGDGINDTWQVYDEYGCLKNITLQVFNRYGNKVFESRDYRNKWDGTFNGKPLPDATYYGVVNFTLITGRVFTVKTDITILR